MVTASQTSTDPLLKGAALSGTFTDTRASGSACPSRTLTWTTVFTRTTIGQPLLGSSYKGASPVVSFDVIAGLPAQPASASEPARPATGKINGLQVSVAKGSCTYASSFKGTIDLSTAFSDGTIREVDAVTSAKQSMACAIFQGTKAAGVFIQSQGAGSSCAPVLAIWSAETPAFSSPPIFAATGQAQVVFNGGSSEELETAGRAVGATGVWAQDRSGTFRLLVVRGPFFLRDAFRQSFRPQPYLGGPDGFTSPTTVTLVR